MIQISKILVKKLKISSVSQMAKILLCPRTPQSRQIEVPPSNKLHFDTCVNINGHLECIRIRQEGCSDLLLKRVEWMYVNKHFS